MLKFMADNSGAKLLFDEGMLKRRGNELYEFYQDEILNKKKIDL